MILNDIERDGSQLGIDFNILKEVNVSIPTLLGCGFKDETCISNYISGKNNKLDGIVFSSFYCLEGSKKAVLVNYPNCWSIK